MRKVVLIAMLTAVVGGVAEGQAIDSCLQKIQHLPPHAVAVTSHTTSLAPKGEVVSVYDVNDGVDPNPHILVRRGNAVLADVEVGKVLEYAEGYRLPHIWEISALSRRTYLVVVTMRGGVDGAGVIFIVLVYREGCYRISVAKRVSQGRLELLSDGTIRVWSAEEPEVASSECTWCAHLYNIETLRRTDAGTYVSIGRIRTHRRYDPRHVTGALVVTHLDEK